MYRKHINSYSKASDLDHLPFYCWDCLTLQLKRRDVDLVIKNEKDMQILLLFLIYRLKTVDGSRETATPLIEMLNKQEMKLYKRSQNRQSLPKSKEHEILSSIEYSVYKKVHFKYKVIKVRAKISFSALQKRMTIQELFLNTIQTTYKKLVIQGQLDGPSEDQQQADNNLYNAVMRGERGCIT